jgi:hypothetical protein
MTQSRALALVLMAVAGCSHAPGGGGGGQAGPSLTLASPSFTLKPGEEMFKCWYTTLATSTDIQAVRMHSKMSLGSHHFIVYTTKTPLRPDGTFEDCGNNQGGPSLQNTPVWLYATQDPEAELLMPSGTALPLVANQPLYFNMHYINATSADMVVNVSLDVDSAIGTYQKVGAYVTYNTQISIPPGGQQTVMGNCDVPAGAQFFTMSTHSHKRTVDAQATKSTGEMLVHTTDWAHAAIGHWDAPSFLTFGPNDQLHYQCSYQNDTTNTITVGESAETNEMCMAVGYYFPAATDTFCLNSSIFSF